MPKHSYIGAILAALLAALKFLFACGLALMAGVLTRHLALDSRQKKGGASASLFN